MITYTHKQLSDLTFASTKEWLMADGDGGFACSTVSFMNTRRQHSLLTVSVNQPLRRMTLLNKIDEEVIIDGKSYFLGSNQYPGTVFPKGYELLSKFTFDYFPEASYDLEGCQLNKKLLMPKRSGSVFLHYDNRSRKTMALRLLPLLSFRLKDSLRSAGDGFLIDELPDGVRIIADMNLPKLYLKLSQMYNTSPQSHWYYNFIYLHDANLYAEDHEDLYNIGYWETELEPGKGVTFAASVRDLGEYAYDEIEARYIELVDGIRASSGLSKTYFHLADIAANHVVRSRAIRSEAIMEGYPYGSITVRETLMSLDGISYVTDKIGERAVKDEPNARARDYERDFLYDLTTNEVSGAFPSKIDEETFHVNYDDPQVPLYFAMALARFAVKDGHSPKGGSRPKADEPSAHAPGGTDIMVRYLPILEEAVDVINRNYLDGTSGRDNSMLILDNSSADNLTKNATNATANALWHNLLMLVDSAKSLRSSSSTADKLSYSGTAQNIREEYFHKFYNDDGSYRHSDGQNEVTTEMVLPLIVPFSPLTEEQRTMVCKILTAKFLGSYGNSSAHASLHHACNLAAIYLTEACSELEECEREFGNMKWYLKKLFSLEDFSNCVDGLPKCGNPGFARSAQADKHNFALEGQDISSAIVTGEAIRLIKKLKIK